MLGDWAKATWLAGGRFQSFVFPGCLFLLLRASELSYKGPHVVGNPSGISLVLEGWYGDTPPPTRLTLISCPGGEIRFRGTAASCAGSSAGAPDTVHTWFSPQAFEPASARGGGGQGQCRCVELLASGLQPVSLQRSDHPPPQPCAKGHPAPVTSGPAHVIPVGGSAFPL